jgi:polysaccharide export outer membrane protein
MSIRVTVYLTSIMLAATSFPAAGQGATAQTGEAGRATPDATAGYVLGPDDLISLRVTDGAELSDKPVRIDTNGYVRLPMLDRVRAGGLTTEQLVAALTERLKPFLHKPEVSVNILEFRSQPVSVIGCVKLPGVHQLQGSKTLIEVLSLAGGLSDDAGYTIKITRENGQGYLRLPHAVDDPSGRFQMAEVRVASLLEAKDPSQNVTVFAHDVISVPRGELIYVTGEVQRSGGFVLREKESMSVLQALSLAGGIGSAAAAKDSRILRAQAGSSRMEIPVDLKKMLSGQSEDLALKPDDILFIPSSVPKKFAVRSIEAAVQMATGVVIWRR